MKNHSVIPDSPFRHPATFNRLGLMVLVVGLILSALIYWTGRGRAATLLSSSKESADTPLPLEDSKKATLQIEKEGGRFELLIFQLTEKLKRPEMEAAAVAAISILLAAGCFLIARKIRPH